MNTVQKQTSSKAKQSSSSSSSSSKSSLHPKIQIFAIFNFIILFGIGLAAIVFGSLFLHDVHTLVETGTVVGGPPLKREGEGKGIPRCQYDSNYYRCDFSIKYDGEHTTDEDGNTHVTTEEKDVTDFISTIPIKLGDEITVYVNPNDYEDIAFYRMPRWIGIFLIIFGIIFVLYSSIPFYM